MTKALTIVQARMSSSRLPGKVLKKIWKKSILELQLERMIHSKLCGDIVVAISNNPNDDILEALCKEKKWNCFRGDEDDLLDRHYQCAKEYGADIVAKVPSDCPLIDPGIMDKVFHYYIDHDFDFVSNLHPATYPDGNDVEVFSFEALQNAYKNAKKNLEREHTTPYFWENPNKFKIGNIEWEKGLDYSMSHRFTIDYQEDFDFITRVFEELYPSKPKFSLIDILNLLNHKPEIYEINSKYAGVNWYRNHIDELKTISKEQTKEL